MKKNVSKVACLVLSLSMVASMAACKKSEKKSSGCVEAAENVLSSIIPLNEKKIKKLAKGSDFDEEIIDKLKVHGQSEMVEAVMEKATFEVDSDSVEEKKKKASCSATVTMPDYEDAMDESDGDPDDFIDAIEGQKEKNYISVDLELEFEVDDDEYVLTNGEEVFDTLFDPLFEAIGSYQVDNPDPTDDTVADTSPADTTPADTTPANTTPADTTPANTTPADTTPADTTPADTTPATSSQQALPLPFKSFKKADLNESIFDNAIKAVDPNASVDDYPLDEIADYKATKYKIATSPNNWNVMYTYYEFESADGAHKYFEDTCALLQSISSGYGLEADYGYLIYESESMDIIYYFSGNAMTVVVTFALDQTAFDQITTFVNALGIA